MKVLLKTICVLISIIVSIYVLYIGIQKISEKPCRPRVYTPNKKFYVDEIQVFSYRQLLFCAPGGGSDNIVGYIRLYRKDGTLLREYFHDAMGHIAPGIDNEAVYLLGESELYWDLTKI